MYIHVPGKHSYYHIDQSSSKKGNKKSLFFGFFVGFLLLLGGIYAFTLTQSPEVIADNTETLKSKEDKLVYENQNFVKIENLNLLVPISKDVAKQVPGSSIWWRRSSQGNPVDGGNFLLCGQRFKLGATPSQTKELSPLYHLEKLEKDSKIDIYYEGLWYSYNVEEKNNAGEDATNIEEPTQDANLTLYTCSANGQPDGTIIIAKPVVDSNSLEETED